MFVIFETLDGLRCVQDCPNISDYPAPRIVVRSMENPDRFKCGPEVRAQDAFPCRRYEWMGPDFDTNLPVYREVKS